MAVVEVAEYKLVKMMRDHLERDLKTNIAVSDEARATGVTIGKFAESPYGIHLAVQADHPLGFTMDRLTASAEHGSSRSERYQPGYFPGESVGGAKWRRFMGTVQVRSVLKGTTPAETVAIMALVKTRIAYCITNDEDLIHISDTYGFHVVSVDMAEEYGYASGGGQTSADIHWCDWVCVCSYRRAY